MTIPRITIEQAKIMFSAVEANMKLANELIDKANEIAPAEQQEGEYITAAQARGKFKDGYLEVLCENGETIKYPAIKPPLQESEYITAAQARELGAGKAEWSCEINGEHWYACTDGCVYASHSQITGVPIKYRAIKQAQPEPVDPHAAIRAEYAKQVKDGTTGFYLWEFIGCGAFVECTDPPKFANGFKYHCTDISCYVSKDGEPAIRMLRTEAQELQRNLGDTVEWETPTGHYDRCEFKFDEKKTYTYRTKATIKLGGNMVTPEQAAAEWRAKKDTHEFWYKHSKKPNFYIPDGRDFIAYALVGSEYELRPKQPIWTGSRNDAIALLKELGLL